MPSVYFGAIQKGTSHYILPAHATKSQEYTCPECDKELILCKGKIKTPYFRHKVDKKDQCKYYSVSPNETQIHKDAKLRLKELLETKKITLLRYCNKCKKTHPHNIPIFCEKYKIYIEYRFEYNGCNKIADVAYLKDNKLIYIFEVYHTHKTDETNRPEPWFELNAKDIIDISTTEGDDFEIQCIREANCDDCIYMDELKISNLNKWVRIKLGQVFHKNTRICIDYEDEYAV